MKHDPTTEVLIEQAAHDAYRLMTYEGSQLHQCGRKVRAGDDVFTVRVILNESWESLHQQASGWPLVYDKLWSMGMTPDMGETGTECVMNFLDSLAERLAD